MQIPNPKIQSNMTYDFARVPKANITRSVFDVPYRHITTFDADYLIPIYVDEVLAGDTHDMKEQALLCRLATLDKPIMDNVKLDVHYWYVPKRLLWDNYERQHGAQDKPGDSTDFLTPIIPSPTGGFVSGSLFDYFGIRPGVTLQGDYSITNWFGRAYNLIWNTNYRDQNLQDSVVVDLDDGPDLFSDYVLLKRGKRHDYFTSALPYPQKGNVSASLPLSGTANIILNPTTGIFPVLRKYDTRASTGAMMVNASSDVVSSSAGTSSYAVFDPQGTLQADLSTATAASINAFRYAFQFQMALEVDARSGTRFVEMLWAHFGVVSPDFRLQRPEFLGGHTFDVNVTPVAQTSESGTSPQANLSGLGVGYSNRRGFVKSFVEPGVIIGLISARADLTYQQGNRAMWYRRTRFDEYYPIFAHIGEQAIYNREIFAQGTSADVAVFGYKEAWSEYKFMPSLITGLMRSDVAGSLDLWHLSIDFASLPSLNSDFIQSNTPIDRVIAVPSEPHFILDYFSKVRKTRPMPVHSVPGLVTRL